MTEEKSEHIIRQEHFISGVETGIESERNRILVLVNTEQNECDCEQPVLHLLTLIKGETNE